MRERNRSMDDGLDLHGLFEHNSTFDYGDYEYKDDCITSSYLGIFVCILYSVAVVLGLLGNVLVLVVLWQKKRQCWSMTDAFVLHLSMADILLLVTMPLWAVDAVKGWSFSTEVCKLSGALFKISYCCGICLLVCISLDLYFYIVHAIQMYSHRRPWLVQLSCLAVWSFCLLLSIPDWMYLSARRFSEQQDIMECVYKYPSKASQLAASSGYMVLGFVLPVLILFYCCSRVLLHSRSDSHVQKHRAVQVIFALVLVFFISWAPYNIALLVDMFQFSSVKSKENECGHYRRTTVKITAVLGFLHSCLNPLVYFSFSEKFRHWVLTVITCGGCSVDTGDYFPLDSREINRATAVPQEEKGSLHPMSDIEQTVTQLQDD